VRLVAAAVARDGRGGLRDWLTLLLPPLLLTMLLLLRLLPPAPTIILRSKAAVAPPLLAWAPRVNIVCASVV